MRWYFINDVCFDLKNNDIQVKKNWGNKIKFKNIETAREVYKAIRDNKIKVDDTYDAFPTVAEIRKMVEKIER